MGVFDRLIVGVDGSEGSTNALRWAAAQVSRGGGEIIAVHGFSPGEQLIAAAAQISLDGIRDGYQALIRGQWIEPAAEYGVESKYEMRDDNGANALMAVATAHGSAVVVVGHHGHTRWSRHHVGNITAKLLHRCHDPLIVTSSDTMPRPISGPVIVGISGTADLEAAHVSWAFDLAEEFDLEICVVGVNQPPSYVDPELSFDSTAIFEANASSMQSLVGELQSRHAQLTVSGEVRNGLATTELAAAAAESSAAIVVLGNHHPSPAAAIVGGSILRHLPSCISCPMAAIPATWGT